MKKLNLSVLDENQDLSKEELKKIKGGQPSSCPCAGDIWDFASSAVSDGCPCVIDFFVLLGGRVGSV